MKKICSWADPSHLIVLSNRNPSELPVPCEVVRPGFLKDLLPRREQINRYRRGDEIWWACGHDLQDDSSALKIPFILAKFIFFRIMGLRIRIIAQGAGPLATPMGRCCTRIMLKLVDSASFRDRESLLLVGRIAPESMHKMRQTVDCALFAADEYMPIRLPVSSDRPLQIGVNLRRWYHFDNHWLPYEYRIRLRMVKDIPGGTEMKELITGMALFLDRQIERQNMCVRMIPMYPPGIEPWENDIALLTQLKSAMAHQDRVEIVSADLRPDQLLSVFNDLDVMIGMRLHATIIATMLGIPSIHLAYSPKGYSYFKMIHQEKLCIPVDGLLSPDGWNRLQEIFEETVGDLDGIGRAIRDRILHLKMNAPSPGK